jgi:hypothetical protein
VVVRTLDQETVRGYVSPHSYLKAEGVELLSTAGQVVFLPYKEVKAVYFVRDFDGDREHAERKVFTSRPKLGGLWLRMKFKDNEVLDGILPNDLLQLTDKGFTITPPDPFANNQRIFVPKTALQELVVLGVIGNPLKQKKRRAPAPPAQISLFNE